MVQGTSLGTDIGRMIEEGVEALRWCRAHFEEQLATERLRELEMTLSSLALALDYEMDGQTVEALRTLEHVDGLRRVPAHPHFIGNPDPPECG